MRKTLTLLVILSLTVSTAISGPVDIEKAQEIAQKFWNSRTTDKSGARLQLAPEFRMSRSNGKENTAQADAPFYVFSTDGSTGFVIVSGEDTLEPIIGYSDNSNTGDIPAPLAALLEEYSRYVNDIRAGNTTPKHSSMITGKRVEPMLTTKWDQGKPYNNMCPTYNGYVTPTGCVATAMAQIMNYHEWPTRPTKAITWDNNLTGATENIDITKHVYDWDNMIDNYSSGYTQTQADAISQLMVDIGKAIQSAYAPGGTGSSIYYVAPAFTNIFNYSQEMVVAKRESYTNDEFMTLLIGNLEAGLPVLATGLGPSYASGHAFVFDGIENSGLIHTNWGWGGLYDGYFNLASLAPEGGGIGGGQEMYNCSLSIVANLKPNNSQAINIQEHLSVTNIYYYVPNSNDPQESAEIMFKNGTAELKFNFSIANLYASRITPYPYLAIENSDGSYRCLDITGPTFGAITQLKVTTGDIKAVISKDSQSNNYIPDGTYNLRFGYKDEDGRFVPYRGSENFTILEVDGNKAKLYHERPKVKLSGISFKGKPEIPYDVLSFFATFYNESRVNSGMLVIPILNRIEKDGTVTSDTITSAAMLTNVYDDWDTYTVFNAVKIINETGDYYLTFTYNLKNSLFADTEIDTENLISIEGRSETFTVEPMGNKAYPKTVNITTPTTAYGKEMNIVATVTNSTTFPFTGTFGLFAEKEGKERLLTEQDVANLISGTNITISYNSANYSPVLEAGKYNIYVCKKENDRWEKIRYDKDYIQVLSEPESPVIYTSSRIIVNNNQSVRQGDSIDVRLTISCTNGDFDGYVRVNNSGTMIIRSGYIPVSLKDGNSIELNIRCKCSGTAPLGYHNTRMTYHSSNKSLLGIISNNTFTYPGNGVFLVHDVTDVDEIESSNTTITAINGTISVSGAPANAIMNVYSIDGRNIYRGTDTNVAVSKGMYIIVMEMPDGNIETYKTIAR